MKIWTKKMIVLPAGWWTILLVAISLCHLEHSDAFVARLKQESWPSTSTTGRITRSPVVELLHKNRDVSLQSVSTPNVVERMENVTMLDLELRQTLEKSYTANQQKSADFSQSPNQLQDQQEEQQPEGWVEPLLWRGVIVFLCALWASNFATAKLVMSEPGVDSSLYAVARFGLSALALAPGAVAAMKRAKIMDGETLVASLTCGSWVAFGYLGQTLGLLSTTASKSCVICSMHCVFVAAIAELWRVQRSNSSTTMMMEKTKYNMTRLLPALLAVIGVAIVELHGAGGAPTIGDALSFAQPIGFGMGYLQLEEIMSKKPEAALPVSALKLLVVALASMGMFELSPLIHGASEFALRIPDFGPILSSPMALGGILYTGLITTAFALWIESIAFAKVPATDASIILTTEPLFAAGLSAVTLGETFGMSDYLGASLIIGACAAAVLLNSHEGNAKVGEAPAIMTEK